MKNVNPAAEQSSAREVHRLIKSALTTYGRARDRVQEAALALMAHAQRYNDCSQAKVLCRGVPARERNSLIGWFKLYSPIGVQIGKTPLDDQCRFIRPGSPNRNEFNLKAAEQNPWYEDPARVNPPPRPLNTLVDFYQQIDQMLARAIKAAEKEGTDAKYDEEVRPILKEQAEDLRNIVNKYRQGHINAVPHPAEPAKKAKAEPAPAA